MDTNASQATTDALGRRSGPRRRRAPEEKRKIVEETLQPGASVAIVARRYELNANVVFGWRRLYHAGRFGKPSGPSEAASAGLIPVKVMTPEAGHTGIRTRPKAPGQPDLIEVQLADGTQVRVSGDLAHEALRQIIAAVRTR
jgi:transposase